MTTEANDDDRTVIRPPGSPAPPGSPTGPSVDPSPAGFQKTEWSAANAVPAYLPADAME